MMIVVKLLWPVKVPLSTILLYFYSVSKVIKKLTEHTEFGQLETYVNAQSAYHVSIYSGFRLD